MDQVDDERAAWIARVLGVSLPKAAFQRPDIVGLWWDAKDLINAQIEELRHAFLATGHPLAQAACEKGLSAFSGGKLTRFQTAVIERRNAAPDKAAEAGKELKRASDELAKFVLSSGTLTILERNPFGVHVTIRRDVLAALAQIVALAGSR